MSHGLFIEAQGERKPSHPRLRSSAGNGARMARSVLALGCCLGLLLLGGCGQKGDLYLPDKPAAQSRG